MIQITCKGNSAICTRTERLTSGMVGLQCKFEFDSAWDGLARTAVFTAGNEKRDVLLQGAICTVPWEVLKTAGYQLVIGVYGTNAGGTLVIPTVYAMCGGIASGADPSGNESVEPTQTLVEQIMAAAGTAVETANAVKAAADAGDFKGDKGDTGPQGPKGDTGAQGPKGDKGDPGDTPDMTAYRTAEAQDVIDAGKQAALIQSGASVGQIAKITAVDDTGKPTAWEAADMPSGGGGMTTAEKTAILTLFKAAAYTSDVSATIADLETLWDSSGGLSASYSNGNLTLDGVTAVYNSAALYLSGVSAAYNNGVLTLT